MANITHNSGNTGPYKWKGGGGVFQVTGTFDGATIKLQWSNDSGTTWVDYPSGSLTADGFVPFNLGETTEIRFNTAGGSGSVNVIATADVADGAVNFSASGIASETTAASLLSELQAHQQGTSAEPVVTEDGGSLFDPNIKTFVDTDINTAGVSLCGALTNKAVLSDLLISCSAACNVSIYSSSETLAILKFSGGADSVQYTPRGKVKSTVAGEGLMIRSDAAANGTVTAITYEEA